MTIELITIAALALANTPYSGHTPVLWPKLSIENGDSYFYRIESSARCEPVAFTRWNPVTAKWGVEAGYKYNNYTGSIGHVSEHAVGIDSQLEKHTESYDFVQLKYRVSF